MARSKLSEEQKVAVLLLSIDPAQAAEVLKNMTEERVEMVARAMHGLQDIPVDQRELKEIQREAIDKLRKKSHVLGSIRTAMRGVFKRALGEDKGLSVVQKAESSGVERQPLAAFDSLTPGEIASLLADEHPQIIAVFLAHLGGEKGGKVLDALPEARRPDLIRRIASLDRTSPDLVQQVLQVMRHKVKALGMGGGKLEPRAWIRIAADLLNNMDGQVDKTVLSKIGEEDRTLADSLRDEMFTFDDLARLDKRSMQKIIASVDTRNLALSLKACEPATEDNVLKNLSKRAKEMIVEERESFGPVPLTEVLKAQKEIVKSVRQLAESGEVKLGTSKEQMV
jgi:flagellar motor switch protein FliG